MSGVLFYLGCSASPLSSAEEDADDENLAHDKYELIDADSGLSKESEDDDVVSGSSPRHIPLALGDPVVQTKKRPIPKLGQKQSNLSLRLERLQIYSPPPQQQQQPASVSAPGSTSATGSTTTPTASSPITSPIEYLASQVVIENDRSYTTVEFPASPPSDSPSQPVGESTGNSSSSKEPNEHHSRPFAVNLDPPSPLALGKPLGESEYDSDSDNLFSPQLSTSTCSIATTPPSSLSDMSSIIRVYQSAQLVGDSHVHDRFLDSRPLLADPEKPFIPCVPVFRDVPELLKTCYPGLSEKEYAYHKNRLEKNRIELRRLRNLVDQQHMSRPLKYVEPTGKRCRIKLH